MSPVPRSLCSRWLASRAIATLVAAATLAATACVGSTDTTAPSNGPQTSRVALAASVGPVAQVSGAAVTLRVSIAYLRTGGDSVPIGVQTFTLADASTQQLPITVDLAGCLGDANRRGAALGSGTNGVCVLRFDLALMQGATVLDRQTVGPVNARPGQTTPADGPVALYTIANVAIVPPSGTPASGPVRAVVGQPITLSATATDASGQPVTGRVPTWTSDNASVATVDSVTGVVTPRATGRATITATVGGRSGTVVVNVVPAPAAVTVSVAGGFGTGTVTSLPAGINCQVAAGVASGTCTFIFPGDAAVTLTATPATGSSFASWGGDCATAGTALTCQLTPSVPRSATVTFVAFRALNVTLAGTGDGTVTSLPAGIACQLAAGATSGTCTAAYLDGNAVTLTATPGATSNFAGWTGACASAALTCTVTLDQARSVTATFQQRTALVTLALSGSAGGSVLQGGTTVCTLTVSGGSSACSLTVPVGTLVSFTARPLGTAQFTGWAGPCAGTDACAFTVSGDVTLGAVFTAAPVVVTPSASGTGAGTLTVTSPVSFSCTLAPGGSPGACQFTVPQGATVVLSVVPDVNTASVTFGGACAGQTGTRCTFTATPGNNPTVSFAPRQYTVSVAPGASNAGAGSVTSSPGAIACGIAATNTTGVCAGTYVVNATITLTASPNAYNTFAGWGGACAGAGTNSTCTVTVTAATAVTASFTPVTYLLNLAPVMDQGGSGTLTAPADVGGTALRCTYTASTGATTGVCTGRYLGGTSVIVTATPNSGSEIRSWAADCVATPATASTCTVSMTQSRTATVFFGGPYTIGVTSAPGSVSGGGIVTGTNGINCTITATSVGGTCAAQYDARAAITYTAVPDSMSWFTGWSAASGAYCGGLTTLQCTFTATGTGVARAGFATASTFELQAGSPSSFGITYGTVSVATTGVPDQLFTATSMNAQNPRFGFGNTVTLTARPAAGYTFVAWQGDCQSAGTSPVCTLPAYRPVPGAGPPNSGLVQAYFTSGRD